MTRVQRCRRIALLLHADGIRSKRYPVCDDMPLKEVYEFADGLWTVVMVSETDTITMDEMRARVAARAEGVSNG